MAANPPPNPTTRTRQEDVKYYMRHNRRGVALIFNHNKFDNGITRPGTDRDRDDLIEVFKHLRFDVRPRDNPSVLEIREELDKVAFQEDHSDADCLVVTVLTHGNGQVLVARDSVYNVSELWSRFTGNDCPSLANKPKIFFIQACRGDEPDSPVIVRTYMDSSQLAFTIPANSDILISYASVEGFAAIRTDHGSWFIQALVEELWENGAVEDLQTILTFVCRRVAVGRVSNAPEKPKLHFKTQTPAFTSMLTRLVYFE